jgi:hypothetical protein
MKRVLLTTTAIVGLSAPAFAADPTAVSDQPYFHHAHPLTWSGAMSIKLSNPSSSDVDSAVTKAGKKDFYFGFLSTNDGGAATTATGIETAVGVVGDSNVASTGHTAASQILSGMHAAINLHESYTIAALTANTTTAAASAVEDVIDDFLGGKFSEAMDVVQEVHGNGEMDLGGAGSAASDLRADMQAFADAQDAAAEAAEKTASINTTASLGVTMTAGDGWSASTSGSLNLGGGSVSGGTLSLSNGTITLSVGKTQHAATAAVTPMFGMDVALDTNTADNQLQATMALGGATIQVDNEMDGDNLETKSQTVGIKGSYGTMSYGLGWQADGDLGFSLGTNLGGVGFNITRVNAGTDYSMGLSASVDLGGGMSLNASNVQNSDGLQDKAFDYDTISKNATTGAYSLANGDGSDATITETFNIKAVHKSISTVGLSYAGGGTSVGITYQEKAGTSAGGDNLIASGSMALSPTITLTGSYNKDSALTTIGASGPLGSAGTISAVMTSTGSSTLTASFKF